MTDPGYCNSKDGPKWTNEDLKAIQSKIRQKLPNPETPPSMESHPITIFSQKLFEESWNNGEFGRTRITLLSLHHLQTLQDSLFLYPENHSPVTYSA